MSCNHDFEVSDGFFRNRHVCRWCGQVKHSLGGGGIVLGAIASVVGIPVVGSLLGIDGDAGPFSDGDRFTRGDV